MIKILEFLCALCIKLTLRPLREKKQCYYQ